MLLKYFASLTIFRKNLGNVLRCSSQMLCLRIFYQVKEVISCKYSTEGLWETSNETFSMESFSTESKVFNCIPGNFLLKICSSFRTTSKNLFWKIMSQHIMQPINIRFCKLSSLLFVCFLCLTLIEITKIRRNAKQGGWIYILITLYIDQNFSHACQPEFLKIWRVQTFQFKNRDILAETGTFYNRKKNWTPGYFSTLPRYLHQQKQKFLGCF